jgi:hypothetical protein
MSAQELIKIEDKDFKLISIIFTMKKEDIKVWQLTLIPKKPIFYSQKNFKEEWIKLILMEPLSVYIQELYVLNLVVICLINFGRKHYFLFFFLSLTF